MYRAISLHLAIWELYMWQTYLLTLLKAYAKLECGTQIGSFNSNESLRSSWYKENHSTQVRRLTWVRSQQNGVFYFVNTNRLCENGFIPFRRDLTSTQARSHLGWMIFLQVIRFCKAFLSTQYCSFSLDLVCFYNYHAKKWKSYYKL